ncbi:amidohydrolase family protein [Lichenicoccus sp.]|uniref:amidohydrolase family protein n=1 Tax=Lichenicoccus sp. TaxID=2781899 RepID=UPI003D09EC92
MRVVALEEHCTFPDIAARIGTEAILARGLTPGGHRPPAIDRAAELPDTGAGRLADMDAAGITMQVLSVAQAGADLLPGEAGVVLARDTNDRLAEIVAGHPDRYAAFAHLPTAAPDAAADELERCVRQLGFCGGMVNGTTGELFLDDPRFESLLARFAALDVPLYLHPSPPPPAIRHIYYDRLPGHSSLLLSIAGWGWHSETAIHVLRLVLSGALDRHRGLKLIIGHMGEGLPAMFARCDQVFADETRERLTRSVSRTLTDQVWVTTSGFFSLPPLMTLLMAFGADRVMFSVDYPFSPNAAGRAFLDALPLSPVDCEKIAHGNADRLLRLNPA